MQRPEVPHKKVYAAILIVAMLLLFTNTIGSLPLWISWIGLGLIVVVEIVMLYFALRQGCRSFAIYTVVMIAVAVGLMLVAEYFSRQIESMPAPSPDEPPRPSRLLNA